MLFFVNVLFSYASVMLCINRIESVREEIKDYKGKVNGPNMTQTQYTRARARTGTHRNNDVTRPTV